MEAGTIAWGTDLLHSGCMMAWRVFLAWRLGACFLTACVKIRGFIAARNLFDRTKGSSS